MAEQIKLDVVTPDKLVLSESVDIVVATATEGEFGVLHGHIPFLTTLQPGELRYRQGGNVHYLAVSGGFAEVSNNKVTILAESAELGREIDMERAQRARERAQQRLEQTRQDEKVDFARSEAALRRAMVRLKVAEKQKAI
ncbi:MAG: F0F1 ATP synthase subunit epsilon [Deltaproteobacteria bacterium]|nr:F0F1 ATP synthase subunit epsilon [Deltaproteobacteria bacterium]MBW2052005.1 F0F1 ATP synthase subunit epsilon [Deltaproteobacteria bacterium]MBW2139965.1 F0F1 ATP synthase subunit epsilon [Deltaproteobacteria bacterium]MBW2322198.1 F0F1 ATP synthase subunit epsilon [Deltaproteobacteria bacterium]